MGQHRRTQQVLAASTRATIQVFKVYLFLANIFSERRGSLTQNRRGGVVAITHLETRAVIEILRTIPYFGKTIL